MGVFQWRDGNGDGSMEWTQKGSDIKGDLDYEYLGIEGCVSIAHDGLAVAVGSEGYDQEGLSSRGLVLVYNYDTISDKWDQSGSDLTGDLAHDQLFNTALYLAVGACSGNYVNILESIGDNYDIIGGKVTSREGRNFGFSVDISTDGAAIAIGDVKFDFLVRTAYLLVRDNLINLPFPSSHQKVICYTICISIVCSDYFFFVDIPFTSTIREWEWEWRYVSI